MLQVQAGPTPGLWFVRAWVALSPQNLGPWKGTEQNQPQHPWDERAHGLGRSWIAENPYLHGSYGFARGIYLPLPGEHLPLRKDWAMLKG